MVNDNTYWTNIENDRRNAEQLRADAAQRSADLEKQQVRDRFTAAMGDAPNYGRNVIKQYMDERGLGYGNDIEQSILNSITNRIPDLDPNPNKYFTREAIGQELDTVAQGTRDRLTNQMKGVFAPGFERTLIPDTADDNIINSILGEQRGQAQKVLDFNKSRGLLNDTGYSAAQSKLDAQGSAGYSTLSQIGESILGKYRGSLGDIRGEAGSAVSGYDYGGPTPNVSDYYGRAAAKAGSDLSGIEGSIRGAVGTTNVFDAPLALQAGGTMQGPINLTTQSAAGGVVAGTEKRDKGRGLGSSGVF